MKSQVLRTFVSPFVIKQKFGEVSYCLQLTGRFTSLHPVFHVSQLAPYHDVGEGSFPPPVLIEGEKQFEIDCYENKTYGDGMAGDWEAANNLNPSKDDSAADPDGDGYSNL